MTQLATNELWSVFDARRIKQPELRGADLFVNGFVGWVKNRRPVLKRLKEQVARIEALEPEIKALGGERFREAVEDCRALARVGKLKDAALDRGLAIVREGC